MVLSEFEIIGGSGIEWSLLNDYFAIWQKEHPDSVVFLDDDFYIGYDSWLAKNYKTINRPSQEMIFRFASVEDKVEFLLRCK